MATGNYGRDKGYNAAAAITKFYAVKFSAAETVTPVTADTDVIAGFAQFGVSTAEIAKGKGCAVRQAGITEAVATAAISVGQLVTLAADGRVTAATSGDRIVGTCVGHPSTNAGDRISLAVEMAGQIAP